MARCPRTDPGRGASLNRSSSAELSNKGLDEDEEPAKYAMSQKAKSLLKQGGPWVSKGTSSPVGLLVIGGVTYSNSSSSSSIGAAAELIPLTRGLPSEHLHKRSAIKSTLASKITLSAQSSSSSWESRTTSSLLASSS